MKSPDSQRGRLIEGRKIAVEIEGRAEREIATLRDAGHTPHLVAVQVGDNAATVVYVKKQKERFSRLGIRYTHLELDEDLGRSRVDGVLDELLEDARGALDDLAGRDAAHDLGGKDADGRHVSVPGGCRSAALRR